jgi:hypothetical protein
MIADAERAIQINFTSNEASTDIDPDKTMPDEVKIENGREVVNVYPRKRRPQCRQTLDLGMEPRGKGQHPFPRSAL